MNPVYDWDVSRQATERIIQLPPRQRQQIFDFFDRIAVNPFQEVEAEFTDSTGNGYRILTFGSKVITFSVDDPVKLIHILSVE